MKLLFSDISPGMFVTAFDWLLLFPKPEWAAWVSRHQNIILYDEQQALNEVRYISNRFYNEETSQGVEIAIAYPPFLILTKTIFGEQRIIQVLSRDKTGWIIYNESTGYRTVKE